MDDCNNPGTSSEGNTQGSTSSTESESDQDTSNSLGNLNIQTSLNKRSCSDDNLALDDEQAPKFRCIRKDDSTSINTAGINAIPITNFASGQENDINNSNIFTLRSREVTNTENSSQWSRPYQGHINSNHICAAEIETEDKRTHINRLPHMLMTKIFSYLPLSDMLRKACLVCQYWRNVAYDPVIWRNIRLSLHSKVSDQTLLGLVQLSQNVNLLDVSDAKFLTSEGMSKVLQRCKFLTTLKLVRVQQLNTECLSAIGKYCPNMKRLYLDSCYSLSNEVLQKLAEGCAEHLEDLTLNYCWNIGDPGVVALSNYCPNMRQLMLSQCDKVTDECIENLTTGCSKLETLMFMSCGLTDVGISKLAKLQYLKVLDVSNIAAVTPRSVEAIVKSCKLLETLNVALCRRINDDCVNVIARSAKKLKNLHMVSCHLTDKALEYIADHSKTIDNLDVGWCQEITLEGVIKVSIGCEKTLRYLGLMRCDKIDPLEMNEVVERFPTITYSTKHLDYMRIINQARKEGHIRKLQNIPL